MEMDLHRSFTIGEACTKKVWLTRLSGKLIDLGWSDSLFLKTTPIVPEVKTYDHYWLTLQYVGWIDLIIIVNFMFLLVYYY